MKRIIISPFFLIATLTVFAQQEQIEEFNYMLLQTRSAKSRYIEYKDIEGSPYSNQELIPGTIVFVSGNHIDSIPLRYNWYTNDMELQYNKEVFSMPVTLEIDHILISNRKFVPFYYLKNINGFMIELCNGYFSLFRRESVQFIEEKPPQSGYDEFQPAKFQWFRPEYFIISKEGTVVEPEMNKKKLPLQFPGLEEKIQSYIKENKINVKKEEDLITLIEKINSWY